MIYTKLMAKTSLFPGNHSSQHFPPNLGINIPDLIAFLNAFLVFYLAYNSK